MNDHRAPDTKEHELPPPAAAAQPPPPPMPQAAEPPGWYADPWTPGAKRYWDGRQWTQSSVLPAPNHWADSWLAVAVGIVIVVVVVLLLGL